jgi:hypothetical protein
LLRQDLLKVESARESHSSLQDLASAKKPY